MGAWKKVHFSVCLIFAGNDFGQTDSADVESEKIKRHVTCRPQRAIRPVREVLILIE